ncbi:MAG: hypothetical protein WCK89_18240 [bacterium]
MLIETSNAYARGLLGGIVAYMRENRHWSICLAEHGRGDVPPVWLSRWKGYGIIARVENKAIARALTRTGLPEGKRPAWRSGPRYESVTICLAGSDRWAGQRNGRQTIFETVASGQ